MDGSIMAIIITSHMLMNAKKLAVPAQPSIPSDMGTPICIRRPIWCEEENVRNHAAAVSKPMTRRKAVCTDYAWSPLCV